MPLDSRSKRGSSIGTLQPWTLSPPSPLDTPGAVDAADRQSGTGSYAGILAAVVAYVPPALPVLDQVGALLQAAGVGTLGSTLFLHALPLEPLLPATAPIVALIEMPGGAPVRSHQAQTSRYEQPTLRVAIQGAPDGYAAARQVAQAAWEVLDGISNAVLSGGRYLAIEALQSPYCLRTDAMNRPTLAFNIRCKRSLP